MRSSTTSDTKLTNLFLDMLAAEQGAGDNTLDAYRRDLTDFSEFLARTGKTLHEASFVTLDSDGNFVAPNEGDKHGAGEVTHGVKIVFSDGSGPNQTLYYFSTDLSDGGVKRSGDRISRT